jgi:hypothetical protein
MRDSADFDSTAIWFSRLEVGALLIVAFDSCWMVNQIPPRQLVAVFDDDRRLFAISKIDLSPQDFGLGFRSPDDR